METSKKNEIIENVDDFVNFTKKHNYDFNYENQQYIAEFFEELKNTTDFCTTTEKNKFRRISKIMGKRRNHINGISKRNKEYWISFGFNENEAIEKVKNIQSNYGKKMWIEDPMKMKINNPSFKEYWISRGFSDKEAGEKTNPLHTNYRLGSDYRPRLQKQISETVKNLHKTTDIYKNKYIKYNDSNVSKKEIHFFNLLKEINEIQHKSFGVNLRGLNEENNYRIFDGYLKCDDKIILFEFDGMYWHNEDDDERIDNKILTNRPDILGIIRVNDYYFKYFKNTIIEDIKNGINEIKNNQKRIIKFYANKKSI